MLCINPAKHALSKLLGAGAQDIQTLATDRWQIAPSTRRYVPSAKFLPGQLERIRKTEFGEFADVLCSLRGGFDATQPETIGYQLRNVDLVDGVLYSQHALRHLRPRRSRLPVYLQPPQTGTGAVYESWIGNRWFGSWLLGDCLTYQIAEQVAPPFTTTLTPWFHQAQYESLLSMSPRRVSRVRFEELFIFDDSSHNDHKRVRATFFRERITQRFTYEEHQGVYLLRGTAGDRRVLVNELAVAEHLSTKHGFKVLDPMKESVDGIVRSCAGARIVAGVEGSHLVHGLMLMPPGATLFVLQPPDRVVSVLKQATDRQAQHFAFLVGGGGSEDFSVDLDEVDRTLDMFD